MTGPAPVASILDARVCIVEASGQNVFFGELLDVIQAALLEMDIEVERTVDYFPPATNDRVYVFVPHEYVPLVLEEGHPSEHQLRRSVAICTEQPGTQWFEETAAVAARAGAAIDINSLGVAELRQRGINAQRLRLGYVAAWDRWGGVDHSPRPVDVTFIGGYTPRRGRALARCAGALSGRRARLHVADSAYPHLADSPHFLGGERRWKAMCESTLLLNVHRSELAYFEWLRVIGAILNGCVLLTEHSIGFDPLVPGEHFLSVSYENLPAALDGLLANPQRVAEVRDAAYSFVRDELSLPTTMAALLDVLAEVAASPIARPRSSEQAPLPLPRPRARRMAEHERIFANHGDLDVLRMAIKQLWLGQRELQHRLADLLAAPGSEPPPDTLERFGPLDTEPRISVVLTVHNYADVVGAAIHSVGLSDYDSAELVVVDDASTDGSLRAVREAVERCPWLPVSLLSHARNQGLPAARNSGIERARGEFVFILDADNLIYRHCLSRLVEALDATPEARFAYGILEQFGPDGPRDLMSWHGWDPARFRYGNYIDAMALLRRSAILEAGGYTTNPDLHGWEDFALWCEFAERGWSACHVPEIVARYRSGLHSMIRITNIDSSTAWSALVARNSFLAR